MVSAIFVDFHLIYFPIRTIPDTCIYMSVAFFTVQFTTIKSISEF